MTQKRKSIAIDMDNVIADIETHFINWYERDFGVRISPESLKGKSELDAFPNKEAIVRYLFTPGFFRTAPVMPGAQEALEKLSDAYDIYIVSAAMEFPQSLSEKQEWLKEYFPFISWRRIIFCGDKSKIATDYMIDDLTRNLDTFTGEGLLFSAGHNEHLDGYDRVQDWKDVLTRLL
jgi:5'-nucleotidase